MEYKHINPEKHKSNHEHINPEKRKPFAKIWDSVDELCQKVNQTGSKRAKEELEKMLFKFNTVEEVRNFFRTVNMSFRLDPKKFLFTKNNAVRQYALEYIHHLEPGQGFDSHLTKKLIKLLTWKEYIGTGQAINPGIKEINFLLKTLEEKIEGIKIAPEPNTFDSGIERNRFLMQIEKNIKDSEKMLVQRINDLKNFPSPPNEFITSLEQVLEKLEKNSG